MKSYLLPLVVLFFFNTILSQSFEGTIGPFPVWMDLVISPDDSAATGTYFYKKVGKTIKLNGEKKGGQLTLKEYIKSGNANGVFVCLIHGDSISGRWGKSISDSSYPVLLVKTDPSRRETALQYTYCEFPDQDAGAQKKKKLGFDRKSVFDGKGYAWLSSGHKASDGYLIAGVDNHKGVFIKVDHNGKKIFERRYSFSSHDELHCARETNDGGYLILGLTSSDDGSSGLMLKLRPNGDELWHKVFKETVEGFLETKNGYIVVGSIDSLACLIKTDLKGNKVGSATYQNKKELNSLNGIISIQSGYLAVGYCRENGNYGWICKMDESFKLAEELTYEADGVFLTDLLQVSPDEYLIAGMIDSGDYHAYLMSIDSELGLRWQMTIPGGDNELETSIAKSGTIILLSGNGKIDNTWISRIDIDVAKVK